MPHDKDRIVMRTGFIRSAIDGAARHTANAKMAREAGNETRAKAQETMASKKLERAKMAADNIGKIVKDRS